MYKKMRVLCFNKKIISLENSHLESVNMLFQESEKLELASLIAPSLLKPTKSPHQPVEQEMIEFNKISEKVEENKDDSPCHSAEPQGSQGIRQKDDKLLYSPNYYENDPFCSQNN